MVVYGNNPSCLISLFFTFFILSSHTHFSICNASESEDEDETPFAYLEGTGKGPKKWGQINPLWQVCEKGKLQSPIDFLDQRVQVVRDLGELNRDYNPAHATIKNRGHDVTVRWKEDAGKIIINGTHFKLLRCHWHSPSEHTFNGTRYNLELHVIHMSSNGTIAVIGITYKYGPPDPFLAKLSSYMSSIGKEEKDIGIVNPDDIKFGSRKYYRYIGSLTTPPCTEGVIWTIVEKVRTVSREQVQALRDAVDDVNFQWGFGFIFQGFEANARPTQQLGGRPILLYDPCVKEGSK
ncbi:hypothetical protein RHSIM_Rhsim03G0029300 [Rhododendron simsii]|uniref:Alpha-carbonic anhydrase domain-containing protein n=1 Tax=Rhododendron simsii TaxID=118357 RepID=A0A834H8S0_RHOSS|nr:hypothetical protein RHSIM_Rhsim03G0029300 [Rhododendron simsii]